MNSSTYHKQDGTNIRAILKKETLKEIETSKIIFPALYDVVELLIDVAGVPSGSTGTVVNIYSPSEEEVEVEFDNANVIAILSRHLKIVAKHT